MISGVSPVIKFNVAEIFESKNEQSSPEINKNFNLGVEKNLLAIILLKQILSILYKIQQWYFFLCLYLSNQEGDQKNRLGDVLPL